MRSHLKMTDTPTSAKLSDIISIGQNNFVHSKFLEWAKLAFGSLGFQPTETELAKLAAASGTFEFATVSKPNITTTQVVDVNNWIEELLKNGQEPSLIVIFNGQRREVFETILRSHGA